MIKLLIADDEAVIRKGIQTSIDWSSYGVTVVGEAKNGKEALEKSVTLQPDIILTDIRMPIMDGLTFAKQIREILPTAKIIILSGYDDFEYAKQAIRIGVNDYVLKPFGAEELINLILKLKGQISEEREKREEDIRVNSIMDESKQLLQAKLIQILFKETYDDYTYIYGKAKLAKLDLNYSLFQVIVFNIDDQYFIMENLPHKDKEFIKNSALNIASEVLNEYVNGNFCISDLDYFVGLIGLEDDSCLDISNICEKIKDAIQKYLKITITIGIGNIYKNIKNIPTSYQEALYALRQKVYLGKNSVIHIKDVSSSAVQIHAPYPVDEEKQLLTALKAVDEDTIKDILSTTFSNFKENFVPEEEVKNYCVKLAVMFTNTVEEMGIDIYNVLGKNTNFYTDIKKYETIDDMERFISCLLNQLIQSLNIYKEQKYKHVVNIIIEYITKHYNENITLKSLSEIVYVTPNYLSKVFKEEIGENFVEWLNKFRIEKAKELLKSGNYKTYEIAEKVGYSDYKYFSYNFKKYTGENTRHYMEKVGFCKPRKRSQTKTPPSA